MKKLIVIAAGLAVWGSSMQVKAQELNTHKHWSKEDSFAINALVMYPENIRLEIFEACEYPAAIVNIASLQKNTSTDFANFAASYTKDVQEDLWNLSRYPGLINQLVTGGRKSNEDMDKMIMSYPDDIHETAGKYAREHFDILVKMNDMQDKSDAQFAQIISDLPPSAQQDFNDLVKLPEVITLLDEHLSLAVRVGDRYKRDPQRVIARADSLNLAEARQNAQDAEAWKQTIQQDPDAQNELKSAAGDYAQENGYTPQEAMAPVNTAVIENYTVYPYPYWFGYPTWYGYPYWYPHPVWYDCGFYYGPNGEIIFIGSPSYYFVNWYFYRPEHYARYPHLGGCYVHHYYGHRRIVNSSSMVVHNWVQENRNYLHKDFATNRELLSNTIKEVGQLHIDAQTHGKTTPEAESRYYNSKLNKYPTLKATSSEPRVPEEKGLNDVRQEPVKMPSNIHNTPTAPVNQERNPNAPSKTPQQRANNYNNVNKAQEYHRSTWEQAQPVNRAPVERSQPAYRAPSQTPSRSPQPSPSSSPRNNGGGRR